MIFTSTYRVKLNKTSNTIQNKYKKRMQILYLHPLSFLLGRLSSLWSPWERYSMQTLK